MNIIDSHDPHRPANEAPIWVRTCDHHGCVITAPHAHGSAS